MKSWTRCSPSFKVLGGTTLLFALSLPSGDPEPAALDILALDQAVVEVVAEAVVRAVRAATGLYGVPAASG